MCAEFTVVGEQIKHKKHQHPLTYQLGNSDYYTCIVCNTGCNGKRYRCDQKTCERSDICLKCVQNGPHLKGLPFYRHEY